MPRRRRLPRALIPAAVATLIPTLLVISTASGTHAAPTFTAPTYVGRYEDPAGIAPLYPAGGDADAAGNVYVADSGGDRIVRLDPKGTRRGGREQGQVRTRSSALRRHGCWL